jgi:acyl-CoA thioester hydrolase
VGNTSSLLAGEMTGSSHRLQIRIYYAHTDFSGVVYHARYLEFFERGRIEYFRKFDERYKDFLTEVDRTLVWVVRHLEMRFRRPAHVDDILTVETKVNDMRGASVRMVQSICRGYESLVQARFECALIGRDGRPQRLPRIWKTLLRFQDEREEDNHHEGKA